MAVDNVVEVSASNNDLVLLCTKHGSKVGFPELRLRVNYPEICIKMGESTSYKMKECTREYWLSPFEDKCYKISATVDGKGCFGDTDAIGLHNLFRALLWGYFLGRKLDEGHPMFCMFKALAFQCLNCLYNWPSSNIYRYDGVRSTFFGELKYLGRGDMIDQYTMAVLIYLSLNDKKYDFVSKEDYEWYFSLPRINEKGELLSGTEKSVAVAIPQEVLEIMCEEEEHE